MRQHGKGAEQIRPEPILRAAARWNVSAALIAAQLLVESNFDPDACRRPAPRESPSSCRNPRPPTPEGSIRPRAGERRPGPPDFGPPAPVSLHRARPRRLQRRPGRRGGVQLRPALSRDPGLRRPHPPPHGRRRGADRAGAGGAARGVSGPSAGGRMDAPASIPHTTLHSILLPVPSAILCRRVGDRGPGHRGPQGLLGRRIGPSEWREVTHDMIDEFAELSGDDQWIHVDVERARARVRSGPRSPTAT
jgi:hypothetical protein